MKPKKVQQTNLKNQKGFFPKMLPRRSPDATYENVHAFNMYITPSISLPNYVSSALYILHEIARSMKFNNKKSYLHSGLDRLVEGCLLRKVTFVDGLKIKQDVTIHYSGAANPGYENPWNL